MTNYTIFKSLHQQAGPLLLGNAWDVSSAGAFEKNGYQAVGTSSAAIAQSLGYPDGEQLPFEVLCHLVQRITSGISIPLSVDLEAGYADTPEACIANIARLHRLGAAGINIEDSTVISGKREISSAASFAANLKTITSGLAELNIPVFMNIRTDTYLLGLPEPLQETLHRISLYRQAGAEGIFIPCLTAAADIQTIVKATPLPVNLMCMPDLPAFAQLNAWGVRRISMGDFLYQAACTEASRQMEKIRSAQNFKSLF